MNDGQGFTQTRSCTDYQERFKYFIVNGQVVDSDRETRTNNRTESQNATGTKVVYATSLTGRCEPGDSIKTNYYMTAPNLSPSGQWEVGPVLGIYSRIGYSTPTQASPASYMGDLVYPGAPLVSGGSSYETCIRN